MLPPVANLMSQFDSVTEHWSPKVIAQVNDQYLKVAKVKGTLAWHKHDGEDELFHVVRGSMVIEYEGGHSVQLNQGDFHVVPRNTMHNPVAAEECWILLVEPATTKHTGDVIIDKTKSIAEQLA